MILDFKPFYVHFNNERHKDDRAYLKSMPRGFTAKIAPSGNTRTVNLQIVHCAYKDDFCKKEGRSRVAEEVVHEVNARDIPEYLTKAAEFCGSWGNYKWILKYLL